MQFTVSVIFAIIAGLSLAFTFLFFLRSERLIDKLNKRDDEFLQLANKENYFEKKYNYLRRDELSFLRLLQQKIGSDYDIIPQVHLSDIVSVKNNVRDHDNLYQLLGQKSVDYVIFSKKDLTPLIAIELNGESHLAYNRKNRDKVVEGILSKVEIKFLPVQADEYFNDEVVEKVLSLL